VKITDRPTGKQRVLTGIAECIAEHGFHPTIRELCWFANLKSSDTVFKHIASLERDGYIVVTRLNGDIRKMAVVFERLGEAGTDARV
jgi:repressor LexA